MRPDDLALLRTRACPTVSPDGRMAVVAVSRLDLEADEYRAQLWAVPTDGSAPGPADQRPGTGTAAPAFSPDGRWLAYLSRRAEGRPQLHVLAAGGGAPRRLTDHPWAPARRSGRRTRGGWPTPPASPSHGRYGTDEDVRPAAEAPRLITTLKYRADGSASPTTGAGTCSSSGCRPTLGDDASPARAVPGDRPGTSTDTDVAWSPDGTELAFVSARHRGRRPRPGQRRLRRPGPTARGCGRCTRSRSLSRTRPTPVERAPSTSPPGPDLGPLRPRLRRPAGSTLCRVAAAGGPVEPLLDPRSTTGATRRRRPSSPTARRLVGVQRRGAVELLRVPLDGGDARGARRRAVHGARGRGGRRRRRRHGRPRPVRR